MTGAEFADLAIGVAGILISFKGVVDGYNLFALIVSRDNGSKHLALKYQVEFQKTVLWGDRFRPDDEHNSPLLRETNATRRLVAGTLAELLAMHKLAEKYVDRYDTGPAKALDDIKDGAAVGTDSKIVESLLHEHNAHHQERKFLWGTKDKAKFSQILERMQSLNSDFNELVREDNSESIAASLSSYLLPHICNTMYLVALQNTDVVDPVLKLLARLKQLHTTADLGQPPSAMYLDFGLSFRESRKPIPATERSVGYFEAEQSLGCQALIEWRVAPARPEEQLQNIVDRRIPSIATILRTAQAPEFHIPNFEALVVDNTYPGTEGKRIGFVFSPPTGMSMP